MAERYLPGKNKILYRTTNFREGVVIVMDIITPSFYWIEDLSLTELKKGLYFLDFNFEETGTYGAVIYEDGVKVQTQAYFIADEPIGIKEDIKVIKSSIQRNKGSRVIN